MLFLILFGHDNPAFGNPEGRELELTALLPYNDTGLYHLTWSGVPVGYLLMDAHETPDTYQITVRTKAIGPLRIATKHNSTMKTNGIKKEGAYFPQHFETDFKLRGNNRFITLDFDSGGRLKTETNDPPEPAWKRPKVPLDLKSDALDPLTAFYAHRPLIHQAFQNGRKEFSLRYYDGRRLTDLHYSVKGLTGLDISDKQVPALEVLVTREAIAGYKEKELKEMADKDMKLRLFFSTDGRFLPLQFIVAAKMGTYYATYRQSCATLEECAGLMK